MKTPSVSLASRYEIEAAKRDKELLACLADFVWSRPSLMSQFSEFMKERRAKDEMLKKQIEPGRYKGEANER